ncbi:putative outer membrane lipoprotein [Burkholderiales bacterium JOSHI_001]|nr:putative outer membrane lipoprotein [Burkholderiales bacterium JOSHI_001]
MRMAPSNTFFFAAAAFAAALAMAPAQAADVPPKPTARQLAGLCDTCVIVTAQAVEKRKGKASGVGAVGGAVAGGVVGNKVGDSTVATVGGAAVGGLLGNEIEKRVKRHKVWITTVTQKDGNTRRFESLSDPQHRLGEMLKVQGDQLVKP